MNIVTDIKKWQTLRQTMRDQSIGFVHTMGNLHQGHLSLCERSQSENNITVVCIFVNPTQFNSKDDFQHYPRTLPEDIALLEKNKIDYLLCPFEPDLYQDQYQIQVTETSLSQELEGAYRPGHFAGMLTIVAKMLNIVQPTRSYYGEKDYQQLLLIKKMTEALFLQIEIIGCPTVREYDLVACSSRNQRLTLEEREKASHFPRILQSGIPLGVMHDQLTKLGFKVDYIAEKWGRRLGAVWLNQIRLIDNMPL